MNASTASGPGSSSAVRGLAAAGTDWNRFWFTPADARPLAVVRIVAAAVGLALWWSYAADVTAWFAPHGMLPVETVRQWRSPMAFSLYDAELKRNSDLYEADMPVQLVLSNALRNAYRCP